jgi:phosphatidylserine/phosphatidylglycerophosphate/cardiolipin synthase-like enzyme
MYAERGLNIANKLRDLWERGCDIKIVYAVFGNNVLKILRHTSRGSVPFHQIASDNNQDGIYDRYLHMKNMSISGNFDGDTNAEVVWNGSANYTSVALASDEIVMRIYNSKLRKQYADWIDYLYNHQPPGAGEGHGAGGIGRIAARRGVNPYVKILAEDGVTPAVLKQ